MGGGGVVDRSYIWESHAEPADLVYPAYAVDDAGNNIETTKVTMITGQRLSLSQLEDLLRRVLATAEPPAPKPEVPAVEKLLQQLMRETDLRLRTLQCRRI